MAEIEDEFVIIEEPFTPCSFPAFPVRFSKETLAWAVFSLILQLKKRDIFDST
jgi:hypothetical protein